ncbi:MAG: hypothetical protein WKG07_15670 [Hymenobacter sp.]
MMLILGASAREWAAVRQALGHRPLHQGAPEHRTFLDQTRERLEQLLAQGVEVRQELRDVQRQLAALPPPSPPTCRWNPKTTKSAWILGAMRKGRLLLRLSIRPMHRRNQPSAAATTRAAAATTGVTGGTVATTARTGAGATTGSAAVPVEAEPLATIEVPAAELVAADVEELLLAPTAELLPELDATGYPAKKKKRRSRGGAKRTARKNAVRLAAGRRARKPTR